MTSKQKTKYGYWSDKQASQNGYSVYNSARGPVRVTMISDDPIKKGYDGGCGDFEYVGRVTNWLSNIDICSYKGYNGDKWILPDDWIAPNDWIVPNNPIEVAEISDNLRKINEEVVRKK